MQLVLFEPEIPPNTGNVARLCAATDTPLHLIEPLGFTISDRHLKRAGLDYWPHVNVTVWPTWDAFASVQPPATRFVLSSSRRGVPLHTFAFRPGDVIVLGSETRGLPEAMTARYPHQVRIPIRGVVRSINMSTAAGILLYEALRQTGGFDFGTSDPEPA
ncbi:MAG: tRNA (cytidine(34)-2'-O)-methyltransferase [Desulfovibrionaceae bacterium]